MTAQNRCLGTTSLPQIADGVSRTTATRSLGSVQSAAKLIDQPENQANDHADDQTGDEREIECAMLAAMNDVSGQAAKAERKLWAQIEKRTDEDEHCSDGEQQTTELLNGFHRDPVANDWFLTFQPAEAKTSMGGEKN